MFSKLYSISCLSKKGNLNIKYLFPILLFFIAFDVVAQDDFNRVYDIFQSKCTICHSNSSPSAGLDLEGIGSGAKSQVYAGMFQANPSNSFSNSKGYKIVVPGDPYRSTLFRKINKGLDDYIELDASEGDDMPPVFDLDTFEIEFIRQWILWGADTSTSIVDSSLITKYYTPGYGVEGIDFIPQAPDESEGFQIKIGPYLIGERGDRDLINLHQLPISDTVEITKVDVFLEDYTHHFILYRDDPIELYKMLTVSNETETVTLPAGTAFEWPDDEKMKINPHYFNFHFDKILGATNYINIYTQPKGTALQIMETDLLHNTNLYIPNDSTEYFFQDDYFWNGDTNTMHVWNLSCHTHRLGHTFNIYERDFWGNIEEHLFSGEHRDGDPMGIYIGYNWDHPPHRIFDYPFIQIIRQNGFRQEASYINTSDTTVGFGSTALDEMMAIIVMYVRDTTGLYGYENSIHAPNHPHNVQFVYPYHSSMMVVNPLDENVHFSLYNLQGQRIQEINLKRYGKAEIEILNSNGIYFYSAISDKTNVLYSGKFLHY